MAGMLAMTRDLIEHDGMLKKSLFGALFCVFASGFANCGEDTPSSIALESFTPQFIDAYCEQETECGFFPDIATCKSSVTIQFEQAIASVNSGAVVYDGTKAADCLANQVPDCNTLGGVEQPKSCEETFVGKSNIGEACLTSVECNGAAECIGGRTADMCRQGTCTALAKVNESCAEVDCDSGLACNGSDVCVPFDTPVGEACTALFECRDSVCVATSATEAVCTALPGKGGACDPTIGGANSGGVISCGLAGEFCLNEVCTPKLAIGASCANLPVNACVPYAECSAAGECVARPGLGATCDIQQRIPCLGNLACQGGTCVQGTAQMVCAGS